MPKPTDRPNISFTPEQEEAFEELNRILDALSEEEDETPNRISRPEIALTSEEEEDEELEELMRALEEPWWEPEGPPQPRPRPCTCGYMRVAGPGPGFDCPVCGNAG